MMLYLIAYDFTDSRDDAIVNFKTAIGLSGAEVWHLCGHTWLVRSAQSMNELAQEIVPHLQHPDDKLLIAPVTTTPMFFGFMEEQIKRILRPLPIPRPRV